MSLERWNERYRAGEQLFDAPNPLVERFAGPLSPGLALDLACGPGRNALYLAQRGWRVTAVDGSPIAIDWLLRRARERKIVVNDRIVDLERGEFQIEPDTYDLICDCYYLQRSLIPPMKRGVKPNGLVVSIVHLAEPDQPQGTTTRAYPGELRSYFSDWAILHYYEGKPRESCHQHSVAEIVARRPMKE